MLFLPWVGVALEALQEPSAGWALLGPMLLGGAPIALYLALERLESWRNEKGPGFRRGLQSLEGL